MILGFLATIGIYVAGLTAGSYIKGRYYPFADEDATFLMISLWPVAIIAYIPGIIIMSIIKWLTLLSMEMQDIGETKRRQKLDEVRRRIDNTEAVRNIDMFEDVSND